MNAKLVLLAAASGALLLFAGCAGTPPKPVRCAPDFRPEAMDSVCVLPIVDARADKKLTLKLESLQNKVQSTLKSKRYNVVLVQDRAQVDGLNDEDIKEPTAKWIKGLGPAEQRWAMVLVVGELSRKLTFGSTGNAEVSLTIFDKQAGVAVWEDKALGQAGQGGLLGMMMVSMMDSEALHSAMNQLLWKIPNKPKTP